MLLRHADRFGHHDIAVGDTLKLPECLPPIFGGRTLPPAKHGTFDVIAFPVDGGAIRSTPSDRPLAHCIIIRRRADGQVTTLAAHHWLRVRDGSNW